MGLIELFSQTYICAEDDALLFTESHLAKARRHLRDVRAAMEEIKTAGMYPGVPSESWDTKTKGGEKDYLYMLFRTAQSGNGHQGPGGVRKLAVGRDAGKIEAARGMAARRARFDELASLASRLESWIRNTHAAILQLERQAQAWPRDKEIQGTASFGLRTDGVPCETSGRGL